MKVKYGNFLFSFTKLIFDALKPKFFLKMFSPLWLTGTAAPSYHCTTNNHCLFRKTFVLIKGFDV